MLSYLSRRTILSIPTLIFISMVIFAFIALSPGDPFTAMANNQSIPPEVKARLREALGLNDPIQVQYLRWVGRLLQGDMGYSFAGGADVRQLIAARVPTTLFIMGTAYVLALVIGITVGVISAVKHNSRIDNVASAVVYVGFSLPEFFAAMLLIIVFSVTLRLLPMSYSSTISGDGLAWGTAMVRQSLMPILVIALYEAAVLTRYVRASMLHVLGMDYIRTARSKGLSEFQVIRGHALRNALIPVVTIAAIQAPALFTGAIIVEQLFGIPGIGNLLIRSFTSKDVPVLMGILVIYAVLVVVFNLIADALYSLLDPRIRRP
jgi:peptide/nickel transport system permease protein